ncbi:MAG: signal recognition particle-docking protein FtsY [Desulfobulbus sp.]|nr:signal recognition particle-docking protein FtsY [Desulfobulbus sp.]
MLGWFKKKFGKKQVEEETLEPELAPQEPAVVEPEGESSQAAQDSAELGKVAVVDESEPEVTETLRDENPAIEEATAPTAEMVFSLSPKQELAFDIAEELNEFFPEPEPEPILEEPLLEEVIETVFEPVESAENVQELVVPVDIQGAGETFAEEPATPDVAAEESEAETEITEEAALEEVTSQPQSADIVEESDPFGGDAAQAEPVAAEEEVVGLAEPSLAEAESLAEEVVAEAEIPESQAFVPEAESEEAIAVEPELEESVEPDAVDLVAGEPEPAAEECEVPSTIPVERLADAAESQELANVAFDAEQGAVAGADAQELVEGEVAEAGEAELVAGEGAIVPAAPLAEKTQEKPASKSLFSRLRDRLGKTRDAFVYRLDRLFLGKKEIDQDLFEQLEEILITADLGVSTTLELMDRARKKVKRDQLSDPQALKNIIREEILAYIEASDRPAELVMPEEGPFVIMVVGVNGVGKTTTIGKVAAKFVRSGQSVLLVAGDTFRAAAINQLRIWGERVGVEVIAQKPGADPSSVVYDGLEYGVAHAYDVIIIDTAGRLHTSVNLMEELKKIKRVIGKKMVGAPHELMLVLDATTGQNGISQAKMFHEAVGVTGLALTKLDGTAKGGIVANVCREIGIPVRFIGIGEQIDDLRDFDAREFVDALFAEPDR